MSGFLIYVKYAITTLESREKVAAVIESTKRLGSEIQASISRFDHLPLFFVMPRFMRGIQWDLDHPDKPGDDQLV